MQALKKYLENISTTSIHNAQRTCRPARWLTAALRACCIRPHCANMALYQAPTRTNIKEASKAAAANQPTARWPWGSTMTAAKSGPMALPPLPPTWKMDCARLLRPPEAICATREASGWNTEEPHPIKATESRMA